MRCKVLIQEDAAGQEIQDVMQDVGVHDSIEQYGARHDQDSQVEELDDRGVDWGCDVADGQCFDQQYDRCNTEDVVVRGKWRQPLYRYVAHPHDEYREIDRQNADHEHQNRKVEVVCFLCSLFVSCAH